MKFNGFNNFNSILLNELLYMLYFILFDCLVLFESPMLHFATTVKIKPKWEALTHLGC